MLRLALIAGLMLAATSSAQQDEAWEPIARIPNRFDPIKDDLGFFWQLTGAGSFYTMGANVFQSANQLSVNGANFAATAAFRLNETRYAFEREWPELKVRRDVWIDTKRSAVRHLELITNRRENGVLRLPVEIRTDFSHVWRDIYSNTGKVFATRLGERDAGMLLKFNPVDGASDFFYVFGDASGQVRPNIRGANSNRQAVLQFNLTIPAGQTVALLYWSGQRTVTDLAAAPELFEPFYRRGPVKPLLPENLAEDAVVNFEIAAPRAPAEAAFDAEALVGLQRLLERMGAERSGEDVLWMSAENQLGGAVQPTQPASFETRFGRIQLDWTELAALRGGGGRNRLHEAFTRDGELFVGTATIPGVRMGGEDGWQMTLDADSLDALLLRVNAQDGKLADGIWGFAELKSGEILALRENPDAALKFATPWGSIPVRLGEVRQLRPVLTPSPRQRLELADSSRLTGFLVSGQAVNVENPRLGQIQLNPGQLRAIWAKSATRPDSSEPTDPGDFDLQWLAGATGPTIWLEGANRLPGKLTGTALHLISGSTVTSVEPGDIAWIRRTEDGVLDRVPLFEMELRNGETMTGRLRETAVRIQARGRAWEAPSLHFLGYQAPKIEP